MDYLAFWVKNHEGSDPGAGGRWVLLLHYFGYHKIDVFQGPDGERIELMEDWLESKIYSPRDYCIMQV